MFAPRANNIFRGQIFYRIRSSLFKLGMMSSTGVIAFTGKRSWKNIPILSLGCVGFFFYPQKVFMLYYTQFFFLRDFFEKKKGAALKISELRLTNEFPWLYKILSNAAKKNSSGFSTQFKNVFNLISTCQVCPDTLIISRVTRWS